jgi:proline iminopeptidase
MWAERSVAHDEGRLVWDEQGEGPAVIFLSGGPGDAGSYLRPLAEPLVERFRCLIPDLRGTGRSQVEDGAPLTIDALLADLDLVRRATGLERVLLVGHSFGATLALLGAARGPEAVTGAALVGLGPLDADAAEEARTRLLAAVAPAHRSAWAAARNRRRAAAATGDREAFQAAFLEQQELSLAALVLDPEAGSRLIEARRSDFDHRPAVHAALNADLATIDQWAAVAQLQVPVLVLYGDRDFEPIRQADAIAEQTEDAEVVIVPGAAHLPWLDQPSAVTTALRSFLDRVAT